MCYSLQVYLLLVEYPIELGLWDLAGWVKEDAYSHTPVSVSIEPERLEHWIDRAKEFVDYIEEFFPQSFMLWRTLHYCMVLHPQISHRD